MSRHSVPSKRIDEKEAVMGFFDKMFSGLTKTRKNIEELEEKIGRASCRERV